MSPSEPSTTRCPQCHRPTTWQENPWRPFCSERCQIIDLGAWAGERYRVAGPSLTVDGSESSSPEDG
ncbi:MAG: DNA gyrase inhibitor YacG [Nitrospira sp.]|nr:MAG: DNA gyrase inhibitor YacG [Nitrospira sp.]